MRSWGEYFDEGQDEHRPGFEVSWRFQRGETIVDVGLMMPLLGAVVASLSATSSRDDRVVLCPVDSSQRARDLETLETSEDAGRAVATASAGASWDAAIAFGIDVTLLVRNLGRSPAQRIAFAASHRRTVVAMQARTVPEAVRFATERTRHAEKLSMLEALVK